MMSKKRYRIISWSVYALFFLIAMVFFALFLTLPKEHALPLFAFEHHNWFFFALRYSLYAVVYFRWSHIARYFNPDASEQVVRSTRKSVGGLIVVYEIFLGINIFRFL